jgi:hypothetical protein
VRGGFTGGGVGRAAGGRCLACVRGCVGLGAWCGCGAGAYENGCPSAVLPQAMDCSSNATDSKLNCSYLQGRERGEGGLGRGVTDNTDGGEGSI